MEKTRLEAFSDGVIAIIITIMVLEMKAPEGTNWEENIKPLLPKFSSYILSFLFVAIYWVNHHHLLQTIKKVSASMMWANINLLFWLSLVPFATAWMGENHFDKITVAVYAVLALMCGISFNTLAKTISSSIADDQELKQIINPKNKKSLFSVFAYTISIPIALMGFPVVSGLLFLLVSIVWMIPSKKIENALND